MHVFLRIDRLLLRQFTEADVDNLVLLDADPEVMRLLTGGRPTPREVVERELLPALLEDYARYASFGRWAALERATGEFVGWFALRPPDAGSSGQVELGYRLRRSAWGKGLRHRRLASARRPGVRRAWRAARLCGDDGRQRCVEACTREGGAPAPQDLPFELGGPDRGHGTGRSRVRAAKSRLGGSKKYRKLIEKRYNLGERRSGCASRVAPASVGHSSVSVLTLRV
jgi:GNAT acetyltransferase-like protein